jgi:hypothetical protein
MNQDFEKRTREVLEESTARLDGRTRSRLTQARHAALAAGAKPGSLFGRGWLRSYAPAGAAAVAVLAVVMWVQRPVDSVVPGSGAVDDMELLADGDAPDFVDDADDPEFYEWAAGEVET